MKRIRYNSFLAFLTLLTVALALLPFASASGQTARDSVLARSIRTDADSTLAHLRRRCANGAGPQYLCVDTTRQKRVQARTDSILKQSAPAPIPVPTTVTVALAAASLTVGQTAQATATVRDQNGAAMTGQVIGWTTSAPSIATVSGSGVVTGVAAGSAAVVATSGGKSGSASVTVTQIVPQPVPGDTSFKTAELPRTYVTTVYPTMTGVVRSVPAGGDLQAAMNAAQPGDVIELAQGVAYAGNFVWPAKACTNSTVVRTAGPDSDFPAFGTRMKPSYASKLAKIVTPNVSYALLIKNGACKLWLSRVEITATPQSATVNYDYGLVRIGEDETSLAAMPRDVVLDRVYVHGGPNVSVQHGVLFNGVANAIIDSHVSDIHWPGTETHAVGGWAGPGPYKIVNNYLEAASINVLFGGAPPIIAGVHPSDVEIRRNHFFKPTAYFGKGYAVKNLLEFKHGLRILIEDNVFENSWADAQTGYAINLLSGGDSHPPGGLAQVADLTFRYNIVRNAPLGFTLAANPYQQANPVTRVVVEHNLFEHIGPFGPVDSEAKGFQLLDNLTHLRVAHNTLIRSADGGAVFVTARDAGVPAASNIVIVDNLAGVNRPYGVPFGNGIGTDALNSWAGTSWRFSGNVLWDSNVTPSTDPRAPAGNLWPLTQSAVGFAADWSLLATSPYKGKASDGTDPGANMATLRARTATVIQP